MASSSGNHTAHDKVGSRFFNIGIYRSQTGRKSIPKGQFYITLGVADSTEVEELIELRIAKWEQLILINGDAGICEAIRAKYPRIPRDQVIHGFFLPVFRELVAHGTIPAFVNFDTQYAADHTQGVDETAGIMAISPKGTFIAANLGLNYSRPNDRAWSPSTWSESSRSAPHIHAKSHIEPRILLALQQAGGYTAHWLTSKDNPMGGASGANTQTYIVTGKKTVMGTFYFQKLV